MMLGAISGLVSAGLGVMQGMYQAQVAQNNAKIATWNASLAESKAQIEQQDQDRKTHGAMGELVAQQGASGVALTSPSAGATRSTVAALGRQDALRIRQEGDIQAWNYKNQAADFKAQAGADQFGAIGSAIGGILGAVKPVASSLMSGASPVSGKWDWMRKPSDAWSYS